MIERKNIIERHGKELKFVILWKKDGIFPFFIDLQGLKEGEISFVIRKRWRQYTLAFYGQDIRGNFDAGRSINKRKYRPLSNILIALGIKIWRKGDTFIYVRYEV